MISSTILFQSCFVCLHCQGVETAEAVKAGQAVAEYTGHVMMADEYQPGNQLNMWVICVLFGYLRS